MSTLNSDRSAVKPQPETPNDEPKPQFARVHGGPGSYRIKSVDALLDRLDTLDADQIRSADLEMVPVVPTATL